MSPDDTNAPGNMKAPGELMSLGAKGGAKQASGLLGQAPIRSQTKGRSTIKHNRPKNPMKWVRMQQGLNPSELALYDYLYKATDEDKKSNIADSEDRVRRLSVSVLAEKTGLSERTCQRVLQELRAKRIIEIIHPPRYGSDEAPTYCVRSFTTVLQIWRQLGLTHFIGGRTRILVDPISPNRRLGGGFRLQTQESTGGEQQLCNGPDESELSPGDMKSPDDLKSPPPGDIKSGGPGDMKSPLSITGNKGRNKYRNTQATATSAVDAAVVAAVMCQYAPSDQAAAAQVIDSACALCPDCTTEDVVAAVRRKGNQLQGQEGVKNPVAVLMTACADLALAARNERVAMEKKRTDEALRDARTKRKATFLAELDGLPSGNEWKQILDGIKSYLAKQSFDTWLKPTRFIGITNRILRVCVPSSEFKLINEKYAVEINRAIQNLGLDVAAVECLTIEELTEGREGEANAH
jgi:hypothetical protein